MSSDGEDLFLTQSTFSKMDSDTVLSDVLDLEEETSQSQMENTMPNFTVKLDIFCDISDEEEMMKITQDVEENARFPKPFKESDLDNLVKEGLSKKTEDKSTWAQKVFTTWQTEREKTALLNKDIQNFKGNILDMSNETLNKALEFFVAEVRNKNGLEYRPNTLYELVIALQHHLRNKKRLVNFLDDKEFVGMRQILDAKMKSLARQGMGLNVKKAEIITENQENLMWETGVLGTDTPKKLLDTLVFILGLHFALRAGQEHRNLRIGPQGQITVKLDATGRKYLEYTEDISKTNAGGIHHRKISAKITRAYENTIHPERCPVHIYEKYVSLRPHNSIDALYLRPKKEPQEVWYCNSPVGVHQLQQTVSKLCENAGFQGHYTNHSLRATAATRMYNAGLDEQLVTEKTGHRSNAVRSYKRTCDKQMIAVSDILHGHQTETSASCHKVPKLKKSETAIDDATCKTNSSELNITTKNMCLTLKF